MKFLGAIDGLSQSLDYHVARHAVLAANLANVDTPGYRPLELERVDGFDSTLASAMSKTDERHLGVAPGGLATKVIVDNTSAPDADGNAVSLDREAAKLTANNIRFETVSTLVSAALSRLSYAANDGRGV
ncbi:MAG: flagellar basal body rod protein FlgB [Polyangiaceae bacterium]